MIKIVKQLASAAAEVETKHSQGFFCLFFSTKTKILVVARNNTNQLPRLLTRFISRWHIIRVMETKIL